jgi:hypothetical protein
MRDSQFSCGLINLCDINGPPPPMFANLYDAVDFLINKYLLPKGDVPIATAAFKLIDANGDEVSSSLPGSVPQYRKYSITLAELQALGADSTGQITLFTPGDPTVIQDFQYITTQGFAGPGLSTAGLNLFYFDTQINALPDAPMIITSLNRQTPVNTSKTDNSSMLPFACPLDANDPGPVIAQFVMTGCNLEDLTAGAITIWVCYATLP